VGEEDNENLIIFEEDYQEASFDGNHSVVIVFLYQIYIKK